MGQGVAEVLTFAIGVAISAMAIIAVILMLFSQRAKVNGPLFLCGWALALAVVSTVVYVLADEGDVDTSSGASDTVSWGKIVFGVIFLLLAARQWRSRPAPGVASPMPKWMAGVDSFTPGKAFGLAVLLAAVNPKNLLLRVGAAAGLAQLGLSTGDEGAGLSIWAVRAFPTRPRGRFGAASLARREVVSPSCAPSGRCRRLVWPLGSVAVQEGGDRALDGRTPAWT